MTRTNYTKYIILGMISSCPLSGYEIRKWVKDTISYFMMDFSYGQIYPMLARLEREGLATMVVEESDKGPDRKLYRITEKGLVELKSWLYGPENGEYDLLLKMCFGSQMDRKVLITKLETYCAKRESEISMFDEYLPVMERSPVFGPDTPYYLMITRLGLTYFKDEITWCKESIKTLKDMNDV